MLEDLIFRTKLKTSEIRADLLKIAYEIAVTDPLFRGSSYAIAFIRYHNDYPMCFKISYAIMGMEIALSVFKYYHEKGKI